VDGGGEESSPSPENEPCVTEFLPGLVKCGLGFADKAGREVGGFCCSRSAAFRSKFFKWSLPAGRDKTVTEKEQNAKRVANVFIE
jgi:hypothetical protein